MDTLFESEVRKGATFSEDRTYRYTLCRVWDEGEQLVACCLNPSTADELTDDPTVTRLSARARQWGYGGLVVVNLFAFRATDPKVMLAATDPVGPDNDAAILLAARSAGIVVAAWGVHGAHRGRAKAVQKLLASNGVALHHLGLTKDGHPKHPLYLPYSVKPVLWEG